MRADVKAWKGRFDNGARKLDLKADNQDDAELLGMLSDAVFLYPLRCDLFTWLKSNLAKYTEVTHGDG